MRHLPVLALMALTLISSAACVTPGRVSNITDIRPTADGRVLVTGQSWSQGRVVGHHTMICAIGEADEALALRDCEPVNVRRALEEMGRIDSGALVQNGLVTHAANPASVRERRDTEDVMAGLKCPKEGVEACGTVSPNVYQCMGGVWRVVRSCGTCAPGPDGLVCQ